MHIFSGCRAASAYSRFGIDNLPGTPRFLQNDCHFAGGSLDQPSYWNLFFWGDRLGLAVLGCQHMESVELIVRLGRLLNRCLIFRSRCTSIGEYELVECFKSKHFFGGWRKDNPTKTTKKNTWMAIRFHFDGNQLKDFPPIEGLKSLTEWGCPRRFTTNRRMGRVVSHIDANPRRIKKGTGACPKYLHTNNNWATIFGFQSHFGQSWAALF